MFFAAWLLYRSRRDQLARVAPARREAEACAGLLLAVVGRADCGVALLADAAALRGAAFPGVSLVAALPAAAALTAWALRHVPRLARRRCSPLVTLGASAWLRARRARGHLAAGSSVDTRRAVGPAGRALPGLRRAGACGRRCCARCSPPARRVLWWRERRAAGEWRRAAAASRTSKALH